MNPMFGRNRKGFKVRAGPSGLHLFDRNTGWNVLVDEVGIPPAQWARAPRQVSIALTNACDLNCSYCYAPKTHGLLDTDRLADWLCELDNNGCFGVGFGGGEPTLHRNFIEICQLAEKQTRLAVTFTTHAHRITSGHADKLKGSVHFVRVSMDGIGATYETVRGRSFAALTSRMEIIRGIAPFGINFVANALTLPDLDAALELSVKWGASEFLLLPERPTDGTTGIDHQTLSRLRTWIHQYRGTIPLAISGCGLENETTCEPIATFNFNVGFVGAADFSIEPVILVIVGPNDPNHNASDFISFGNLNGKGVLAFISDSATPFPFIPPVNGILCTETDSGGCVGSFTLATTTGSTITVTAASDGISFFDPFGAGFDTSDGLQMTTKGVPEPGSFALLAFGLVGLAGTLRKKLLSR
jgi:pyruvate-formate lyase-activating enzyme